MSGRTRTLSLASAAIATALVLASCGDDAAGDDSATTNDDATSEIVIEDALGSVTLDGPATRIVALEWTYVEELIALDVTPVGVADIAGYDAWVTAGDRLPADVVDVGTRQEPSLEQITALEPDLIISTTDRLTANIEALREIAPVIAFTPNEGDQFATMKDNFGKLALAVDRTSEAEAVLADLDAVIADVTERLANSEDAARPIAVSQGFSADGAPTLRLFGDDAQVISVLAEVGLTNAWTEPVDDWAMSTVDVEALRSVEDASFLYVAADDDNDRQI
jgi:ferric hydroxamate transport system substrate-binding protein